jgi:hypothetical protein
MPDTTAACCSLHNLQAFGMWPDVGLQLKLTSTMLLGAFTIGLAVAVHMLHKCHVEKRARQNAPPSRLMNLYSLLPCTSPQRTC